MWKLKAQILLKAEATCSKKRLYWKRVTRTRERLLKREKFSVSSFKGPKQML